MSKDSELTRVFRVPRILGVFPLDRDLFPTKRALLRSAAVLSLSVITSTVSLLVPAEVQIRRCLKVMGANCTNLVTVVLLLNKRDEVLSLRDGVRRVTELLAEDGTPWCWRPGLLRSHRGHIVYLTVLFINLGVRLHLYGFLTNLAHAASYLSTIPLLIAIIDQFIVIQELLGALYEAVGKMSGVRGTVLAADTLLLTATSVQRIYGLQLLLYLVCLFSFVVCNIYYELTAAGCRSPEAVFVHFLWLLSFIFSLFDVITTSQRTANKARKVNEILYKRMMEDQSDDLINDDILEFHVTCPRELEFTACGVYKLDTSLIHSMIAVATTYLVLLLQYRGQLL